MFHEQDVDLEINGYDVKACVSGFYYAARKSGTCLEPNEPASFSITSIKAYPVEPDHKNMPMADLSLIMPAGLLTEIEEEVIAGIE